MKIKVISEFYDKFHTNTLYTEGMVLDFDEERANDIIAHKLGVKVEEEKPAPKPAPKKEAPVVKKPVAEKPVESEEKEELKAKEK